MSVHSNFLLVVSFAGFMQFIQSVPVAEVLATEESIQVCDVVLLKSSTRQAVQIAALDLYA